MNPLCHICRVTVSGTICLNVYHSSPAIHLHQLSLYHTSHWADSIQSACLSVQIASRNGFIWTSIFLFWLARPLNQNTNWLLKPSGCYVCAYVYMYLDSYIYFYNWFWLFCQSCRFWSVQYDKNMPHKTNYTSLIPHYKFSGNHLFNSMAPQQILAQRLY